MFNDKASDTDRQKKLEDLIRKDYADDADDVAGDSEIPTDDQINEIISRSQEEYEIFNRIDQERYIVEGRDARVQEIIDRVPEKRYVNPANINYRLLQDWEVPDWIRTTKPEDPSLQQELGLGKRKRNQVNYNDEISEGQWLKIIDQGGDPNEEVEKIRKRRQEAAEAGVVKRQKVGEY